MIDLLVWLTNLPAETIEAAIGGFILRLIGAMTSVFMLSLCALVGAKMMSIPLRKCVDRVEQNPMAFAVFVVGHFIGAAIIIAYAMG